MAKLSNAEIYAKRVTSALAKGFTLSQARGHPKKSELSISLSKTVKLVTKITNTTAYDKRVTTALAKGFTRSQARGHAKSHELPLSFLKPESKKLENKELSRRGLDLLNELLTNPRTMNSDKVEAIARYKLFKKTRSKDDFYDFLRFYQEALGRSDFVDGFNIGGPS